MASFDPNGAAPKDSGIFGLPYNAEESALILIPVPWEATTSYGGGTSLGPEAIFRASKQVDLFDKDFGRFYEAGIFMAPASPTITQWNTIAKNQASEVIQAIENGLNPTVDLPDALSCVNDYSDKINQYVYTEVKKYLDQHKLVGVVGGDHSTPFGAIQAFLEIYPEMGILHFDAHADLRDSYEGFLYSHASIMHNVMMKTGLKKLVQVGIRDFCEQEYDFIQANKDKITVFFDSDLIEQKGSGRTWGQLCEEIIGSLPHEVYISFDIDGLDPRFCPNTGTPVPGGLEYTEVVFLLKKLAQSGRKIVGFDLNEVSPGESNKAFSDEWDANVGARLLYKLCGLTLKNSN